MAETWKPILASRDTPEFPHNKWQSREHLFLVLSLHGVAAQDFDAQRSQLAKENLKADLSDQRLRTYRKLYERLGVIRRKDGLLHLTKLGFKLQQFLNEDFPSQNLFKDIKALAVNTLIKYQPDNPTESHMGSTPIQILPIQTLWKMMRALDNKIHIEEWLRVVTKLESINDISNAISRIHNGRNSLDYNDPNADFTGHFGNSSITDEQQDARFASHMSLCGWGGLIIEPRSDSGYRCLSSDVIPIVDSALNQKNKPSVFATEDEWFDHYTSEQNTISFTTLSDEIYQHLEKHKNIILYGPPGTGKSFVVEDNILPRFKQGSVENSLIVSFHPSYGYENFVEGLRPVAVPGGGINFEIKSGILLEVFELCKKCDKFCLFIDEINRGNVAEIFGEFLVSIEKSKREKTKVKLSLSGTEYEVPSNLYIIGAMNTADRSLVKLDSAFRRRFFFHRMDPNYGELQAYFDAHKSHKGIVNGIELALFLKSLNQNVSIIIGRDFQIGQSDFFSIENFFDLNEIFLNKILPLLDEYCHGDLSLLADLLNESEDAGYILFAPETSPSGGLAPETVSLKQVEFRALPEEFYKKIIS